MDWQDYLARLSSLLVVRNEEKRPLEVLKELDGFHREAAARGEADGPFIAALGAPEALAKSLREDAPEKWRDKLLFLGGILLLLGLTLVVQLRDTFWSLYSWPLVACAALLPLALWFLFRVSPRAEAAFFADRNGKSHRYGVWIGALLLVLFFVFFLSAELWMGIPSGSTIAKLSPLARSGLEWGILLLGGLGLVRSVRDVFLCRIGAFPACCAWFGLFCTKTLAIDPFVSMSATFNADLSLTAQIAVGEIPAFVCFALTFAVAALLRFLLKKKREEVHTKWMHN